MAKKLANISGIKPDYREFKDSDKLLLSRCYTGIEIETEGIGAVRAGVEDLKFWTIKNDGSLRDGGVEFVFSDPLRGNDIVEALESLEGVIDKHYPKISMSERTSVHVHIDVRNYTNEQLFNYIILFIIFEKILFTYVGMDKYDSNFCAPMAACNSSYKSLYKLALNNDNSIHRALGASGKYSSMNIGAVLNFGSVEFRMHKGVYKTQPIIDWLNILYCLKNYINSYKGSPQDIIDKVCAQGMGFFNSVFLKYTSHIKLTTGDIQSYMLEGAREAQHITNMEAMEKNIEDMYSSTEEGGLLQELYGGKSKGPPPLSKVAHADITAEEIHIRDREGLDRITRGQPQHRVETPEQARIRERAQRFFAQSTPTGTTSIEIPTHPEDEEV